MELSLFWTPYEYQLQNSGRIWFLALCRLCLDPATLHLHLTNIGFYDGI